MSRPAQASATSPARTFAEIAVHLPRVQGTFHYHLPASLESILRPGHLVVVPFGPRRVHGIVVALAAEAPVPETRPVDALVDPDPVLTPAQLDLARWLAQATRSTLAESLAIMLPPGLAQRADTRYALLEVEPPTRNDTEARLAHLLQARGPLRGRQLDRLLPHRDWARAAEALHRRGLVSRESVLEGHAVHPRRVRRARLAVDRAKAGEARSDLGDTARPASA